MSAPRDVESHSEEPQRTPPQGVEETMSRNAQIARRRAQWRRLTASELPLSAEETAALMDWMRNEARKQKRWRQGMQLLLACFVAGFFLLLVGRHLWNWNVSGYAGLINLINVFNLSLMLAWNSDANRKKLAALSTLTDVHLVGPLCEIAVSVNSDMRRMAQDALMRMLPRLQASDAACFTPEQRAALYSLVYSRDVGLVRIVLKSLEQIGDGSALPYVQNLADGKYLAARDLRARVWAQRCLPFVAERARQEQVSRTLLRPAPVEKGDTLLRATVVAEETPQQQLLRATQEQHREC